MSKQLSVAEVAEHKDAGSGMYIIIDENVYDVTSESSFIAPSSATLFAPFTAASRIPVILCPNAVRYN